MSKLHLGFLLVLAGHCVLQNQEATMALSSAFKAVTNTPGLIIWRIEVG